MTCKVIYDVLTNIVFLIAWRNTSLRNHLITIVTKIQWLAFSDNLKVQCHDPWEGRINYYIYCNAAGELPYWAKWPGRILKFNFICWEIWFRKRGNYLNSQSLQWPSYLIIFNKVTQTIISFIWNRGCARSYIELPLHSDFWRSHIAKIEIFHKLGHVPVQIKTCPLWYRQATDIGLKMHKKVWF